MDNHPNPRVPFMDFTSRSCSPISDSNACLLPKRISSLQVHELFDVTEKVPRVGGRELDLYMLYRNVTSLGGCERVIQTKHWREAAESFSFPETITSVSFSLRKAYFTFLWDYEQVRSGPETIHMRLLNVCMSLLKPSMSVALNPIMSCIGIIHIRPSDDLCLALKPSTSCCKTIQVSL